MVEPTEEGVARALGRIEGRLEGIDHRLESAEQSRKEMYRRFDAHNADVAGMRHDIGDLTKRVGALEEQIKRSLIVADRVEAYERDGKRAVAIAVKGGALAGGLIKRVLQAGGLAVLAFWREIVDFVTGR